MEIIREPPSSFTEMRTAVAPRDWRRLALRKPRRQDIDAARELIAEVDDRVVQPALEPLKTANLDTLLRFMNALPDLIFLIIAEDESGYLRIRCSRNPPAVCQLVRQRLGIDTELSSERVDDEEGVSERVVQRRNRVAWAVEWVGEMMADRSDFRFVMAWHVAGGISSDLLSSDWMSEEHIQDRLTWFARNVAGIRVPDYQDCSLRGA